MHGDRVLFIDGEALVIDKPAGLPVDPPRDGAISLENHLDSLRFGFQRWPQPVHRLDRDTSGCLLLSRNPQAHARFQQAFEGGLVAAFDAAMAGVPRAAPLVLDLSDTASGGNTVQARAIMGWFVDRPTGYQLHRLPAEERETGVARQWIEQVLPRAGKRHRGPVTVRVGRWTGSMGEGLAIGMHAIGARVVGTRMAGLLGAIYDFPLPASGVVVKLPAERLSATDGTPREAFVPRVR